jgi:CBS domain containing-hemolysin-like protein
MTITLLTLAAAVVLAVTTLLSAIDLALIQVSDSALERKLRAGGHLESRSWIFDRKQSADHAVAFLRTMGRIGFFALVLVEFIGLGGDVRWGPVLGAFAVAAVLLWLFTGVVSAAIARYASAGLIAATLPGLWLVDLLMRPFTAVAQVMDEAIKRLVGAPADGEDAEEELLRSIEDTERQGGIDPTSAQMLENVVEFSDTLVGSIMTPRTAIEGLEYTDDLAVIRSFIHEEGHSRIPVFEESLDHVLGILYVKDLVRWIGQDARDFRLRPLLRPPVRVPETKRVSELRRHGGTGDHRGRAGGDRGRDPRRARAGGGGGGRPARGVARAMGGRRARLDRPGERRDGGVAERGGRFRHDRRIRAQ